MLTGKCNVVELIDAEHKSNIIHSHIKLLTGMTHGNVTTTCIGANNGSIIMNAYLLVSIHWLYIR